MLTGREEEPALSGAELRRRAGGGVALLTARSAVVLVLGVGANIALARMLVPADFGLVALGTVFVVLGGQLAYGVGAGLVRGSEEPAREVLAAVSGLQLAGTVVLALAVAAVAAPLGRDALVVATMAASVPLIVLRAPSVIVLERRLRYREISIAEVVEAVTFYAWALAAVGLGAGVWGIATGTVVRATVGTATIARLGPTGLLRPRWSWSLARPQLGFGLRFQAVTLAAAAREQGVNVAVAVVAGVSTLGVWNLTWRILQMPFVIFAAVGRVAYPAISRLLDAGGDPRPALERTAATLAVGAGVALAAIASFSPALPVLVGGGWEQVPPTVLWSSVALVVGPPIGLVASGYLMASDDLWAIVGSTLAGAAAWLVVTLPLVACLGAPAVGIGWIAGAAVAALLVARRVRGRCGARLVRSVAVPVVLAVVAIGAGWGTARLVGESLLAGGLGAAAGEVAFLGGLALVRRGLLRETRDVLADALARRPA